MRRLRNHLIGIDQGEKVLFSDFEDGGDMWSGSGSRTRRIPVIFSESFKAAPSVRVSIDMWDMDKNANSRADISAEGVTPAGFDIVFKTWGDTKVARVRAAWFAIGEVKDDDEWDLY